MLRTSVLAAILATGFALPSLAEETTVSRPIAAASLHEGPLDMVAYFKPLAAGSYEVTATFAEHDGKGEPMRVVMAMRDGDHVRFGMPGYRDASYEFTRSGDKLSVSVEAVERTALVE